MHDNYIMSGALNKAEAEAAQETGVARREAKS